MAAFAQYHQTMALNANNTDNNDPANDFTLFPAFDWTQDQTFVPTTSYADQSYLHSTTFDSSFSHPAYAPPLADPYHFEASQPYQQLEETNHSPTNSASHSFEYTQPTLISSTSDSGASVYSTNSSAMASPSMQPQHANDWAQQQQQQQLGLIPNIVHHDAMAEDAFAATSGLYDSAQVMDTTKGCVGELQTISSYHHQPQRHISELDFDFTSITTSRSPAQSASWTAQYPTAFDFGGSEVAPPFASDAQPTITPGATLESPSPNDSVFKSPNTPASAASPHVRSPVLERVKGRRPSAAATLGRGRRNASPLAHSTSYSEYDVSDHPQAPRSTFSSPFFSQSSGIFVPPLQSTCPSLVLPIFSFLFFLYLARARKNEHY